MRVALITDQHFGARNDSIQMHNYFEKFYSEFFFPTLEENNIDTVIQLGDIFDRRKYINYFSLSQSRKYFFDVLEKRGVTLHSIIGNHDIYYKNTNYVNSPQLLLQDYKKFYFYPKAIETEFDGTKILFVPWINSENADETFELLENTDAQIVMGHLELSGFEMYKGSVIDSGFSTKYFNRFDIVMSGHYHHKSTRENIHYLGSPYEMTWSDYNDPRGFHIFDTSTRDLKYCQNPYSIFHKIFYDDEVKSESDILEADYSALTDSYVKVIIKNKSNPYIFDRFVDIINQKNPCNIQVVEANHYLDATNEEDMISEAEDSITSIKKYIQKLSVNNTAAVESLFNELYYEAMTME